MPHLQDFSGPNMNGVKTGNMIMAGYRVANLKKFLNPTQANNATSDNNNVGMNVDDNAFTNFINTPVGLLFVIMCIRP